jgi:hypothetical protein
LSQFDDGSISAAHVSQRAALASQTKDDIDHQTDLVRQHWVKIDETLSRETRQLHVSRQLGMGLDSDGVAHMLLGGSAWQRCSWRERVRRDFSVSKSDGTARG